MQRRLGKMFMNYCPCILLEWTSLQAIEPVDFVLIANEMFLLWQLKTASEVD